jgi:hypothetical protein
VSRSTAWFLLWSLIGASALLTPTGPAQAQSNPVCAQVLPSAEEQYLETNYDEALRLIAACLNQSDIPSGQAVSAYRLLALVHLKRDELEQARSAVLNLLGVEPDYVADPVASPPAYVSLVAIVKRDLQSTIAREEVAEPQRRRPFFRRTSTWVTIGGVLVGSGVATVLALGGGDGGGEEPPPTGPDPLPFPPTTP